MLYGRCDSQNANFINTIVLQSVAAEQSTATTLRVLRNAQWTRQLVKAVQACSTSGSAEAGRRREQGDDLSPKR